jgi:glycosyltransferase involved in cell wall biosynthesis
MIKVLHISPNTYPKLGQKEHHTKRIWQELAKDVNEYHVFARSQDNSFSHTIEGNIHLHLIPKLHLKQRVFILSSFYMIKIIKQYKINRLLVQSALFGGIAATFYSKILNIPIMIEIHGDIYFKFMRGNSISDRFFSMLIKYSYNNASKIRSLSSKMTEDLKNEDIISEIITIPNRVDFSLFKSQKKNYKLSNPIKVVSVGRFVPQKGYDIAIDSIKTLTNKYNIELYLIGGGKLYDSFQKQIEEYRNIHLIKWIKQSELIELICNADIYIQPSKPFLGEAMPRTILEAMALKLPIIASNIAAIPGILNQGNSLLIEPNSIENLSEALETLINNEDLRTKIAKNSYEDAYVKYEWKKVFTKFRSEIINMKYDS